MRKRLVAIYSVLVVAIVLLAAFVPSCAQIGCTFQVKATLCGEPWTGNVSYNLTPASGGSAINGHNVNATFGVACNSTWTCAYVSGGPPGAHLVGITPSVTQNVSASGTITFFLNFEKDQDAAIQWLTWTINGIRWVENYTPELGPCNITDVHFLQWVNGCTGYSVTLNETDWLTITASPANPGPVWIYVVNATCAVNKTANAVKVSQMPSINNATAYVGDNISLVPGNTTMLDVHTVWQLVKGTNYTKSINWLGISMAPFELPGPHPCVLFELVVSVPGMYTFQLVANAHVDLVGSMDHNLTNNDAVSPALTLNVLVP